MVELSSGPARAWLCPETGGALARLCWHGIDILRPVTPEDLAASNVRRLGMFPLAPYSNRIADGLLPSAAGLEARALRRNVPGEPHSMHGFAWQRAWHARQDSPRHALLTLDHAPDADWPFPCRVEQRFELHDHELRVQLDLVNTGPAAMPAGLGFHPYFPRTPETRLQVNWDGCWDMDERKLPTGWRPMAAAEDFRQSRPVGAWTTDHCYTGWDGAAVLDYGTHRTIVSADAVCTRLVCFVPEDGRPLIALEPVSHINNAFVLAAQGVTGTGMRLLAPGARMALAMRIAMER